MTHSQDVNVNVNVITRVVLTEYGAKVINHHNKSYHITGDVERDERYFPTNYKAGDCIEKPLWELMSIFGPYISQANPIVFVSNIITLFREL